MVSSGVFNGAVFQLNATPTPLNPTYALEVIKETIEETDGESFEYQPHFDNEMVSNSKVGEIFYVSTGSEFSCKKCP